MAETQSFTLRGILKGHNGKQIHIKAYLFLAGWVSSICTNPENPDVLVTGSRGMFYFFSSPFV